MSDFDKWNDRVQVAADLSHQKLGLPPWAIRAIRSDVLTETPYSNETEMADRIRYALHVWQLPCPAAKLEMVARDAMVGIEYIGEICRRSGLLSDLGDEDE